jgi:4-coumarate--CoA ligase
VICVLESVYNGWNLIVMARFELEAACALIQRYEIGWAYVVPPMLLALGKDPIVDKYDLRSLRVLQSAAAPLTRELTELVWRRLKTTVKQGYGLSETSPAVMGQSWDEWAMFMGSTGKLGPNMEAQIVDEEGNEVANGMPGELWLKGPNVFVGYLDQPERTRESFSACGYLKTGDVFRRDQYGNYYCEDRLKELIKYKGFPVAPAELEGILVSHDDVADVAVIGVYDHQQATELPRAYVALRDGVEGSEAKAEELAAWLAALVAPFKKLRGGIRFVDEVPKSPSGKILRRILRDRAKQEERQQGPRL